MVTKRVLTMAAAALLFACDGNGNDPGDGAVTNVQVSFATQAAAPLQQMSADYFLDDTTVAGTDTLIITSAELVLREIELRRVGVVQCDTSATTDDCEEFEAGPILLSLPLTAGVQAAANVDVPEGSYDRVEFEIHKPSDDNRADSLFVQANPDFADISIRARGTFNGQAFEFTSDLNVEQELALNPILQITGESQPRNITVLVGLDEWFLDATGALVDPVTGNKGGVNENLIRDNIQRAIEAFEDDDRDGRR